MTDTWDSLTAFSDAYTCYSSAIAAWTAFADVDWAGTVDPGLWLTLTREADGLFGFVHFPPGLRRALGLRRTGAATADEALDGVLAEVRRSGRVIVAGNGFRLPWHVAHERVHVPHWYVLIDDGDCATVFDPFTCRNALGIQSDHRAAVSERELPALLRGLTGDDPVLALRETFALGDNGGPPPGAPYQWYVHEPLPEAVEPIGSFGPVAVRALAEHFRVRGQHENAYRQVDDIWSIARHRAFLARRAQARAARADDAVLAAWVEEHAAPLAKRWGHMPPLLMQATLALGAGRAATASVPDTLDTLAALESAAAAALPTAL
jgi:hypothetical protein